MIFYLFLTSFNDICKFRKYLRMRLKKDKISLFPTNMKKIDKSFGLFSKAVK